MKSRELFLQERQKVIGGSDIENLTGLDRGCPRRLWYDKSLIPADFPFLGNRHTRRGTALELPAIEEFLLTQDTYAGIPGGEAFYTHPSYPYLGAHIDAHLWKKAEQVPHMVPKNRGVLEVKCPSLYTYHLLQSEGPTVASQLQLQWYMLIRDLSWGVIWLFSADRWEGTAFEIEADKDMQADLLLLANELWLKVCQQRLGHDSGGPEQLDPEDFRCRVCPWRRTCQGIDKDWVPSEDWDEAAVSQEVERDESLFGVMADYLVAQKKMKEAKDLYEEARAAIIASLRNEPRLVETTLGKISYKKIQRKEYTVKAGTYYQLRVIPYKQEEI